MILCLIALIRRNTTRIIILLVHLTRFKPFHPLPHLRPPLLLLALRLLLLVTDCLVAGQHIIVEMGTEVALSKDAGRAIRASVHMDRGVGGGGSVAEHKGILVFVYFVLVLHNFELRFVKFGLLDWLRVKNLRPWLLLLYHQQLLHRLSILSHFLPQRLYFTSISLHQLRLQMLYNLRTQLTVLRLERTLGLKS